MRVREESAMRDMRERLQRCNTERDRQMKDREMREREECERNLECQERKMVREICAR